MPPSLLAAYGGGASLSLPPEHTMNPTIPAEPAEGYSPDPLAGTSFRTLRKLGEGSMGLVVEAENCALGTVVVIKLLHAALAIRADYVDRLRLEAQALARLRHPNLVIVTDFSVTPAGVPFFVMERLAGRTVEDERRVRGALPLREAIAIVRQALAGLAAVHAAGIVHRDIKSANLFLCDADAGGLRVVKVLDFGIAKVLSSAPVGRAPQPLRFPTAEGATVGTPRCLSPEQACGGPVDGRTDIYAAGVLLYALLVGRGPFDHLRSAVALLDAHVHLPPEPPSRLAAQPIPPAVEAAILRALAKRPDDRFASALEFSDALGRATSAVVPATNPRPLQRFDTEPLAPPPDDEDVTIWIPPVPGLPPVPAAQRAVLGSETEKLTEKLPPWAAREPWPTRRPSGLGFAIFIVGLSAFASAAVAALLAWVFLFRR